MNQEEADQDVVDEVIIYRDGSTLFTSRSAQYNIPRWVQNAAVLNRISSAEIRECVCNIAPTAEITKAIKNVCN